MKKLLFALLVASSIGMVQGADRAADSDGGYPPMDCSQCSNQSCINACTTYNKCLEMHPSQQTNCYVNFYNKFKKYGCAQSCQPDYVESGSGE